MLVSFAAGHSLKKIAHLGLPLLIYFRERHFVQRLMKVGSLHVSDQQVRRRAKKANNYSNPPNAGRSTFPATLRGDVPCIPSADPSLPAKENKFFDDLRPASRTFLQSNFFLPFTQRI